MTEPGAGAPTPAGWYADGTGGTRWWDGRAWTQHLAPAAPVAAPMPYALPATTLAAPAEPLHDPWVAAPSAGMSGTARGPRRTGIVVALVGVTAGVLVVGVGSAALLSRNASTHTATAPSSPARIVAPSVTPSGTSNEAPTDAASSPARTGVLPVTSSAQGTVVYSDDFTDTGSGWGRLALPSGTRFGYAGGRYVVVAKGNLHHYSYAPYGDGVAQISVTADYVTTAAKAGASGIGVSCDQGEGKAALLYEFMVYPGKEWFIEEVRGSIGSDPPTSVLAHGRTTVRPGRIAVTGACTTSADGSRTVVTLFVNGAKAGQATAKRRSSADGWLAGVDVASLGSKAQTVAVESVTVRDTNG